MSDLSDLIDRLENRILMVTTTGFTDSLLTEAIRSTLSRIGEVYGEVLTLEGLDLASTSTLSDCDFEILLTGAELLLLERLLAGYDDTGTIIEPEETLEVKVAEAKETFMEGKEGIRKRLLQKSADGPVSEWEFVETFDWSEH